MHAQGIRALVTSQVPLGTAGKTVYRLGALPVPRACAPDEDCARYASVELFVLRADSAARVLKPRPQVPPASRLRVREEVLILRPGTIAAKVERAVLLSYAPDDADTTACIEEFWVFSPSNWR